METVDGFFSVLNFKKIELKELVDAFDEKDEEKSCKLEFLRNL